MTATERVMKALMDAEGVAFDGCHKIFILLDEAQVKLMVEHGYGQDETSKLLVVGEGMSRSEMFDMVKQWWQSSCMLKFVQSIAMGEEGEKFENIIPQGGRWRP